MIRWAVDSHLLIAFGPISSSQRMALCVLLLTTSNENREAGAMHENFSSRPKF
jgi:hypothetical protein